MPDYIPSSDAEFNDWLDRQPERNPSNYEAAFYGFVRRWDAKNHL